MIHKKNLNKIAFSWQSHLRLWIHEHNVAAHMIVSLPIIEKKFPMEAE